MKTNYDFKKVFEMLDKMEACADRIKALNNKLNDAVAFHTKQAA